MRAGHTFTRGFNRPFDDIFMKSMQETAKYMCENIGNVKLAYIQSDEITIILVDYDTLETDCWFNYRTDKLCSVSASIATFAFNRAFEKNIKDIIYRTDDMEEYFDDGSGQLIPTEKYYANSLSKAAEKGATFDARAFNIPKEEVCNLIYWRQLDATRNSINMVAQANFSHKELQGKSCNMMQDMLMTEKGINWNDFPVYQKRGSACRRVESEVNIAGTIDTISTWEIDLEMPILKSEGRQYVERLI